MTILRLISAGALVWALIFVEWSILAFAPVVKDMEMIQWIISYILLVPIVIFGVTNFYRKESKMINGFLLGLGMLVTGAILDSIITVPFFIIPQGSNYLEFFTSPWALVGFVWYIVIAGVYWTMKIKASEEIVPVSGNENALVGQEPLE